MGGEEDFELLVVGKGSHGAMPHQGIDPITAGAAIVQALQVLVSRETDPLGSAVVSVTIFQGGDAYNVIPAKVKLGGTIRAITVDGLESLKKRFLEVVHSVASAHRCSVEAVLFSPDLYPPVVNDPAVWNWLQSPDAGIVGGDGFNYTELPPTFASEDFSFFSLKVPASFIFVGIGSGKPTAAPDFPTDTALHNPAYNMDENVLHMGAALHAQLALRSLEQLAAGEVHAAGQEL
eukprot:gnl/TRDRNA2_/TRDRNA2_81701_c1_seq1.p1 gnl/TRDRNA2_/TRDRNA2_81701_c1~~gnl/TRDRNA2_/TRDRNA2_81701_c1_seq1.p1  ORF type:complete len:243 (+),score=49.15 gnl/TRDRNA2_/TRDRNA2_81701_c1_seq1:30-731(+)